MGTLERGGGPAKPRGCARMPGWRRLLRALLEGALMTGTCPAAGPGVRGGAENQFGVFQGLVPHGRAEAGCGGRRKRGAGRGGGRGVVMPVRADTSSCVPASLPAVVLRCGPPRWSSAVVLRAPSQLTPFFSRAGCWEGGAGLAVLGSGLRLNHPAVTERVLQHLLPHPTPVSSTDVLISDCFLMTLSPGLGWAGESRWLPKSGALIGGGGLLDSLIQGRVSCPKGNVCSRVPRPQLLCQASPGYIFLVR